METFIDELISRDDSSSGALFQQSYLGRENFVLPKIESSVSTVKRRMRTSTPPLLLINDLQKKGEVLRVQAN